MGNWKSEENINYFKENSYLALAEDFLERGYEFYVDGFTPQPLFRINYIERSEDIINLKEISLQSYQINFENYKEMISILEKLNKDNYVFMFSIKPFEIRIATVSSELELVGINRNQRIREQKINELLNE